MKARILDYIDFEKVNTLLEGFNKSTGFVTAILDLEGNVLSKSGWRQICTDFHRINPETGKKCRISDTVLANKMAAGEKYHFYKCLNGLIDVAVPVIINGEHIANLFSGQFFFEEPDIPFFKKQAKKYGFDEIKYLDALSKVPIVSQEKVKTAMDFLLNMTQLISETTFQKIELQEDIEAQKLAEEKMQKQNGYIKMILDNFPIGVATNEIDSMKVTYMNRKFSEIYGWPEDDFPYVGEFFEKVFPDMEYRQQLQDRILADISSGDSERMNWDNLKITTKAGDQRIVYAHNIPLLSQNIMVSTVQDITERKQAEEKIRQDSSLIRIAAEKAKLGGWNVDLKENRSYWSDEVAAIHEMPPGYAPLVEDGINFYPPEWRDRIIKVFTECAGNGVPYDEEMEIITSTGKRVWVRTIGEAVRDENGQIFKVQGAFQDISEKKLVEAKVRAKDLQFRKLSANVPDLIFQFTRKSDGTYCVPIASEGIKYIFGCSPEDVEDDFTPIGKVIYPDDAERVIADIEYSAKHLTHFTSEFRVQIPGRPLQWILTRSTPEKLPDGSITWYGFNANITERKHAEEEIKRQLDELQRWHQVTLGREGRILELKKEVNDLLQQHGEALRYGSTIPKNTDFETKA